jgi:hypothetical protein
MFHDKIKTQLKLRSASMEDYHIAYQSKISGFAAKSLKFFIEK